MNRVKIKTLFSFPDLNYDYLFCRPLKFKVFYLNTYFYFRFSFALTTYNCKIKLSFSHKKFLYFYLNFFFVNLRVFTVLYLYKLHFFKKEHHIFPKYYLINYFRILYATTNTFEII